MSEVRRREVIQLLRDYRTFWTGYGGAMPVDETGVKDANYGPAGLIEAGSEFAFRQRESLAHSYRLLEHALTLLKADGPSGFAAYLALLAPYLGDPGDPSIVAEWRKKRPGLAKWHDLAIDRLADYLKDEDLYVIFPKRMTSREEKQIERRNDELFATYRRLREDGLKKTDAVKGAAAMCGYSERRTWDVVEVREGKKPA